MPIMNLKNIGLAILFSTSLLTTALTGCISTESVEPAASGPKDEKITIMVSAPEAFSPSSTRAVDKGLQLRYVAKLYEGDKADKGKFLQRKELLATDGLIVFTAPKGKYTVAIFADYIDAGATADSKGYYPDKFYDTSAEGPSIIMLAIRSNDKLNSNKVNYPNNSINNDNYDCFAKIFTFTKEETVYESKLTLKRAVSKVKIISTDGVAEGVDKIRLTKFSFMDEYNINENRSVSHNDIVKSNIVEISPSNIGGKELFYFYTFGSLQSSGQGPAAIAFDIIGKDEYEYQSVTIPGSTFLPIANYVYNIKGSFLTPTSAPAPPSDEIRLTVNRNEDWEGTHERQVQ